MKSKVYVVILMLVLSMLVSNIALANPQTYNLSFMDEDIRVVLHTLAKISNVDMVIDDSIKGNITIKLNDVSFVGALDLITSGKGLSYRKVGNSYIIDPADMGTSEVVKLRYTQATEIKKTLNSIVGGLKVKIEANETSNDLIISGPPSGVARVKTMLADLDVYQQQVTMEAKVVVINKVDAKNLGVDWSFEAPLNPTYSTSDPVYNSSGQMTTPPITHVTHTATNGFILFGHNPDGQAYQFNYNTKINALLSNTNTKILARPNLTTISGKEAHILIGDHIPVLTTSTSGGSTTTTITYVDAGIKLSFTPTITADGNITSKVHTEVSSATLETAISNYRITSREAETTVCMKDGETIVIGGLIGNTDTKGNNSVPFLSNVPIIGGFFKSVSNSKVDNEVVIFLTARVVK